MSTDLIIAMWFFVCWVILMVFLDYLIGWRVIKRVEDYVNKGKKDVLDSIKEVWPLKMAEVEARIVTITDIANTNIDKTINEANANIETANKIIQQANTVKAKPASLKLTVDFKGMKK
jgi:hypothetical protein